MIEYPHALDEDFLEGHFHTKRKHYRSRIAQAAMAAAKKEVDYFTGRHVEARQLAAMQHALEASPRKIRKWLVAACDHAEAAVELGGVPGPYVHMTYLALAILCEREELRMPLQETQPQSSAHEIFTHTANAKRHLAAGRTDDARAAVDAGLASADGAHTDARDVMAPLLALADAVLARSEVKLAAAMIACHEEFERSFDADLSVDADGLLNFIALGFLQIAKDDGVQAVVDERYRCYLPVELLR